MSTPDFAPGITSVLPTDLKHFASSTSHPGVTPSTRSSGVAVSLRSTSSSSPSSSSTGSQSSPATSSLASSSILGGAASSLSMTTASSPGSANGGHAGRTQDYGGSVDSEKSESGRMEDDDAAGMPSAGTRERQRSDSGSRELAELSMQESTTEPTAPMRVDTTMTGSSSGTAHGTKTRRASTISSSGSSSNSHHQPFATTEEAGWWAVPGAGTKGGREGQPARRKAPRMGSFEGSQSSTQTQAPTPQQMKADAPEQQAQGGPRDGGDSRRGSVSAASASRHAPPVVPNNTRPPVPGSAFPSSSISAAHPAPASSSSTPRPAQQHVDIVSYPSPDLLRLLASLLEQIAHANDSLHQRASQSRSGSTSPADARTGEGSSHYSMETQQSFSQGRFDAAPLNSPSTPRYRRGSIESDLAAASAAANSHAEVSAPTEMPVTPGVDLLREVGGNSGVEGFMPSLGGNHVPQPLARRRGSSFLRNRERDEAAALSSSFGKSGSTPAGTGTSALADKPDPGPAAAIISSAATGSATSGGTTTPPNTAPGQATEPPLASLLTASSQALASPSATLCFHARNVPAISIEAYLLRILKYCPTTNEVFLSLLVYFDRMARVGLEAQKGGAGAAGAGARTGGSRGGGAARERARSGGELDTRPFAIDSFNVHRLVIAGVTVASKFFSDVFYTNSRYAKVGGLPLNELNQLELQFLLLNDFNLVVSVDELQRYGDQLILHWVGRNAKGGGGGGAVTTQSTATSSSSSQPQAQSQSQGAMAPPPPSSSSSSSTSSAAPLQPTPARSTPPLTTSAVAQAQAPASSASASSSSSQTTDAPQQSSSKATSSSFSNGTPSAPIAATAGWTARPRSVRSQRSSEGGTSSSSSVSVASTVTPGTPSTPRHEDDDGSEEEQEQEQERWREREQEEDESGEREGEVGRRQAEERGHDDMDED